MPDKRESQPTAQTHFWQWMVFFSLATIMTVMPAFSFGLVRVPNSALMAAAIQSPKPDYPPLAKNQQAQGQVEVDVVVTTEGTVKEATAISGHLLLRDTAKVTALKWKFDPAKLHNEQDVIGTLVFNFKLN